MSYLMRFFLRRIDVKIGIGPMTFTLFFPVTVGTSLTFRFFVFLGAGGRTLSIFYFTQVTGDA